MRGDTRLSRATRPLSILRPWQKRRTPRLSAKPFGSPIGVGNSLGSPIAYDTTGDVQPPRFRWTELRVKHFDIRDELIELAPILSRVVSCTGIVDIDDRVNNAWFTGSLGIITLAGKLCIFDAKLR